MILLRTVRKQPKTCAGCSRAIPRGNLYACLDRQAAGHKRGTALCVDCGDRVHRTWAREPVLATVVESGREGCNPLEVMSPGASSPSVGVEPAARALVWWRW